MPTFAITGASGGIGLELTRQLAARGEKVYALCRSAKPELSAVAGDVVIVPGIDSSKDEVVQALASSVLASVTIDVLVHNAGGYGTAAATQAELFESQTLEAVTTDAMRNAFELNTLGPLRITKALLPMIAAPGGKIAIISTMFGSIGDNGSGGSYAYRTSKAAVNMVGKSMSCDLKKKGVCVSMIHPGLVQTNFGPGAEEIKKVMNGKPVDVATKGVLEAIDAMTMENTGGFVHANYGEGLKDCPW